MTFPVLFVVIFFIPVGSFIGIQIGRRRRQAQAHRLEAYRSSPESHLLNLHD